MPRRRVLDAGHGRDIDALAAAAYAHGEDAIDVAVERIAMMIEVRDEVLKGRQENPNSFRRSGRRTRL